MLPNAGSHPCAGFRYSRDHVRERPEGARPWSVRPYGMVHSLSEQSCSAHQCPDTRLLRMVAEFVAEGLDAGEAAILVGSDAECRAIFAELCGLSTDVEHFERTGA